MRIMGWPLALPAILSVAALGSCVGSGSAVAEAAPEVEEEAPQVIAVEETIATASPAQVAEPQNLSFEFAGELTQGGYIRGRAPDGAVSAMLGDQALELGPEGDFFAAFDRDSSASIELVAVLSNDQLVRETLTVSPREWNIQRVNVAKRPSGSSEAWWRRREPEYNAIVNARAQVTGAEGWKQDFIWPVKGRISGLFGRQRIYRGGEAGSYHSGIDIAPGNGVPYVAPADGVVVLARMGFSLEGGLIIIDHGGGLNSAFLHSSRIVVEEGQAVRQGQHIGNVGSTGRSTGPHLHWGLKWNDARLDPLLFTGPMS